MAGTYKPYKCPSACMYIACHCYNYPATLAYRIAHRLNLTTKAFILKL